jgi:hypothetical protein
VFVLAGVPAMAQYGNSIAVGPQLAFPTGNFDDDADMGSGFYGDLQFPWTQEIDLLADFGYVVGDGMNDNPNVDFNWSMIPMQFGGKYYVEPNHEGLYLGALTGLHFANKELIIRNVGTFEDHTTNFSLAPLIGYEAMIGRSTALDLSGRYQFVEHDNSYFGLRAGLNFDLR